MRAHLILTVLAVGLTGPAWGDDHAVTRGQSQGSHSSSGAVDRHPSPSGGGQSSSSLSGSHDSGSAAVPRTEAQARHPRPGTGTGYRRGGHYGGYYGGYYGYRPYYYGGYYGYPYWGWGYGWYGGGYYPPYYPYRNYNAYGSLRVIVEPEKTRVYVDGYYAGVSDDFDGMFQRLNVSPGRHEVALKLEGYRTHRVKIYAPADTTVKIRHDMLKGTGEATVEDRTGDEDRPAYRDRDRDDSDRDEERYDPDRERYDRDRYERRRPSRDERDEDVPPPATLRLRVAPEDASIYIDGRFRGTGRQLDELLLPPGRHKLEVVRPGYRTHEAEFDVSEGKPTDLEVSLDKL